MSTHHEVHPLIVSITSAARPGRGNLCRCAAYPNIVRAIRQIAKETE